MRCATALLLSSLVISTAHADRVSDAVAYQATQNVIAVSSAIILKQAGMDPTLSNNAMGFTTQLRTGMSENTYRQQNDQQSKLNFLTD